jgi:iron complex outermembrane receptor protein
MSDIAPPHLETITVTSERVKGFEARVVEVGVFRDADILDVPLTVNVVPRSVMDLQEARGLFDALKNTAGVARSQVNGVLADNLSIRGVAVENRSNYRLNGALPVNNLIEMPMEDKERVEVLKGSSALYYGFTSPTGVVNMVMKRAGPQPVTAFTVYGNEFGALGAHADIGRTFGARGELGVRVNLVSGQDRNAIKGYSGERSLAAAAMDWRPADALSFGLDVEQIRRSGVEQASVGLNPAVNNVVTLPHVPDPTRLLSGTWALMDGHAANLQGRADYFFGPNWSLMAEIGRADTRRDRRASSQMLNYDVGTGAGTLRVALTQGQAYINDNDRIELAGRFLTGSLDHEISAGFMQNRRYQSGPGQQVVNLPQNLYDPVALPEPPLTAHLTQSPQVIRDKGAYVFDRIRWGEEWQFQAGVRRTDYNDQSVGSVYAVKDNTPSAGVIWKGLRDTSVYASYIEGLEEGGTAPLITNNAGQVLPPGVTRQKEAGVRSEAIPGLLLSGAFFTVERPSTYVNASNFFVLDGRTKYKGFEYSAVGALGTQCSVYLSGMFLHAEQSNAQNPAVVGKAPDNTPKQTHSAFVDYRPGSLPGFDLNAGAYYMGRRFINNLEQGAIPGYTLFALGAGYSVRWIGELSTFRLYVENATDKRYWAGAGGGVLAVGLPRAARLSMQVEF